MAGADGAQIQQIIQALATGTPAHIQARNDFIQGQREMGNKQQSVDFCHRARLAKRLRKLDEKANGLHFHRAQAGGAMGLGLDSVPLHWHYNNTDIILFNKK